MSRAIRLPEDQLNNWLDEGTYYDWLYLAKACRKRLIDEIVKLDDQGEDKMRDALYRQADKIFNTDITW